MQGIIFYHIRSLDPAVNRREYARYPFKNFFELLQMKNRKDIFKNGSVKAYLPEVSLCIFEGYILFYAH